MLTSNTSSYASTRATSGGHFFNAFELYFDLNHLSPTAANTEKCLPDLSSFLILCFEV